MAASGPGSTPSNRMVYITNPREIRFFIKHLKIDNLLDPYIKENTDKLNDVINDKLKTNNDKEKLPFIILSLRNKFLTEMLPIESFEWIENDIICFYVWGRIRRFHNYERLDRYHLMVDILEINTAKKLPNEINYYEELKLKPCPSSTKERLNIIIEFFDSEEPLLDLIQKNNLLENIKHEWMVIYNKKKPFDWLNEEDENLCEWTWDYIKKHSDFCQYLHPINNKEKYLSIYTSYYLWRAQQDTKQLFLIKINKAVAQQKFRESIKGKKALNVFISNDSKNKLDKISKKMNEKINKTIEYLIEKEYNNQNK